MSAPNVWGVLGNATPVYDDLHPAYTHATDETEDADGYVTWNGVSPNAWNSAEREDW